AILIGIAKQVASLLLQTWRKICGHIVKEGIRCWSWHGFSLAHCFIQLFFNGFKHLLILLLGKQVTFHQEMLEALNWIFGFPRFDFGGFPIASGIIGSSMSANAIGEGFYKCWSLA